MNKAEGKSNINRWVIIVLLGIIGGIIYELPFLKYTYEEGMKELMGYSSTQLGVLASTYGMVGFVAYIVGGYVSDKFDRRKLISLACLITGALGFVMAMYPPFWVMLLIQIVWVITTVILMWSAMFKTTALLGTKEEQGFIMGVLEGVRGGGCIVFAFLTLGIFSTLGGLSNPNSLRWVILTYSIAVVAFSVIMWFVIPSSKGEKSDDSGNISAKDVVGVLKLKTTWYCSFIIFGVYLVFDIMSYTISYLVDVFAMPIIIATTIGIIRNQVMRFACAPIGGIITKKSKSKSATKVIVGATIINVIALFMIFILPSQKSLLPLLIGIVLVAAFCVYVGRGLYMATFGEVETPKNILGTTIGVASIIGYSPDAFIYILIGHWIDTLPPVQAYRNMWLVGLLGGVIALVAAILLLAEIKKKHAVAKQVEMA